MESLERARDRARRKQNPADIKPAEVNTLEDIKRYLHELDPSKNQKEAEVPITAKLESFDGSKKEVCSVSTSTISKSKRDYLVEGLSIIKNRMESPIKYADSIEINGVEVKPARLGSVINNHHWVDPLIRFWLDGRRDGTTIYWELNDGYKYKYDIFNHKLTKVSNE